jgi:hypothetical protein
LSFFDEDDEPRTTPRPRRAAPPGPVATDSQTLLIRRAVALGAAALILILMVIAVRGCLNTQKENALKDYNTEVASIAQASDRQVSGPFFELIRSPGNEEPQDLQTNISQFRVEADKQLDTARDLDVPDDMQPAQRSLLIALEFRRDGLDEIAKNIRTALGDQGEAATAAIRRIAGAMRYFDASDVVYTARVQTLIKKALDDAEIGGQTIAPSQFLPDIAWISETTVADRLNQQLSEGSRRRREPAPGLHGTGLVDGGVTVGDTALQAGAANRIPASTKTITVKFQNQGENDETDVKVNVSIRGGGKTVRGSDTVETIARGQTATADVRLNGNLTAGSTVTINVEVAKVPGEEKTDNNKAEYQAGVVGG